MPRRLKEDAGHVAGASLVVILFAALKALDPEIEVFFVLTTVFALCSLRCFLGPMRRCLDHRFVQYGAMAAYYLPAPFVFYAAYVAYSSGTDLGRQVVQFFLPLALGNPNKYFVMKAYSISDSPLPGWQILRWFLSICISPFYRRPICSGDKAIISSYIIVLLAVMISKVESPGAFIGDVKAFSKYMKLEPFSDGDASSLYHSCKYPFTRKGGNIITIKDLLQSDCTVDPDICLSFSLSQLLARRYFEFDCAEEGHAKVRDFALKELLQDPDHNRAFNIVEVQLAYVHDMFFTYYPFELATALPPGTEFGLTALGTVTAVVILVLAGFHYYIFAFILALAVFLSILLAQYLRNRAQPMYWHPIQHILSSYPHTGRCSQTSTKREREYYWRNKIGQYSLIEDYDRRSAKKTFIAWFKEHMLSKVSPIASFIKHHPAEEEDVRVPDNVRRSVARTLQDVNGRPTNGTRSLYRYRDIVRNDLTWTCRQETHTHTILIWHIATCILDVSPPGNKEPLETRNCHEVATVLSRYCAYLVAFDPELLPGSSTETTITIQEVLQEARDLLGRTRMSMEEKRARIQELQLSEADAQTTFKKGVTLARQLEELDSSSRRWEVMAEFWTETMLYVAPSDKVAAHIDRLAKGGEFVTHLWAMLSNAGILKRAAEEWSPPQPQPVVPDPVIAGEEHRLHRSLSLNAVIAQEEHRLRRSRSLQTF